MCFNSISINEKLLLLAKISIVKLVLLELSKKQNYRTKTH